VHTTFDGRTFEFQLGISLYDEAYGTFYGNTVGIKHLVCVFGVCVCMCVCMCVCVCVRECGCGCAWGGGQATSFAPGCIMQVQVSRNLMFVWLHGCIVVWLYGCMVVWLHGYGCMVMVVWLFGCVVVWLHGCMVVWLHGCMVVWLYGCMVVWLHGRMVVWLYGCMVVWLHGCMVVWLYVLFHTYIYRSRLNPTRSKTRWSHLLVHIRSDDMPANACQRWCVVLALVLFSETFRCGSGVSEGMFAVFYHDTVSSLVS